MLDKLSTKDLLFGVLLVGIALYYWLKKQKVNLPPGPMGLPIFGYLPFLSKEKQKDFVQLQKKYGDIFSLYLGSELVVILNEFQLVKEAFEHPAFIDRPEGLFDFHPDGLGFLGSSGSEWMEQRRYTMRNLRDIGLGKSGWIDHLEAEVCDFVKIIEDNVGRPINLLEPISASVSSNITSLMFGKRLPMGDPRRKLVDEETESVAHVFTQAGFLTIFPKLAALLAKIGLSEMSKDLEIMEDFNKFVRTEIHNHEIGGDSGHQETYIDGYMREIEKHKNDPNSSFNEKSLIGNISAMVNAGSETTRTSLLWLLLAMAEYQNVQKKVHEEIDHILGKDGKCNWMERNKLPYTYATILELQRWKPVVYLGVVHRANEDANIGGFEIPKGSRVISNIWALHYDQKYWKEPEKFDPNRFLLKDGTLMQQKPESFAPFSVGRRSCPGEFISLIEILHYFTAIMQKFQVHPPKGKKLKLEGYSGATYTPFSQELLFTYRD